MNATLNNSPAPVVSPAVCRMLRKATEACILLRSRVGRMERAIFAMSTENEEEREVLNMALADCNATKLFADFASIGMERMERAASANDGATVRHNLKGVLRSYRNALAI